jgi:4-hydroxy-tetrahydrodipicolinate reductase
MQKVDPSRTRVIVHGATGRMGARLCRAFHDDRAFELVAALTRAGSPRIGQRAVHDAHARNVVQIAQNTDVLADIVIDFSTDKGAHAAIEIARRARAALLVGTTALSQRTLDALRDEALQRAVLIAPNTSPGVTIMAEIVREIFFALGPDYHCSIIESHHEHKRDAPSGTALRLAQQLRSAGATIENDQICSIRAGDIIGEHIVRITGSGECIELVHRATSRDLFAAGALRAATWLRNQKPGLWSMADALGIGAS